MDVKKEGVEAERSGWKEGKITRVTDLTAQGGKVLVFAVAKVGEKFPGPHFIIEVGNQMPVIPSEENFLDWEKPVVEKQIPGVVKLEKPKHKPVLNESIVFELVGDKIIWCSKSIYSKARFDARRKFKKQAA